MLSYRHAFHAGNHADVLKHFILTEVLRYSTQKDKPFWYIDTHAGAGQYALDSGYALQNAEYKEGIAKLLNADLSINSDIPSALKAYLELISSMNTPSMLAHYPGSPVVAEAMIRDTDKMRLFELHPNDFKFLRQTFPEQSKQTTIALQDGFAGIKALLPPPTRRAVVLIDPPYEDKQDYQRVVDSVKDSLKRFATGTYMVWYPLLQRPEPRAMVDKLKLVLPNNWLNVTLSIEGPSPDGFGMYGSGMFILNPPWTLPKLLEETMPYLTEKLAKDPQANFTLESEIA